MRRRAGLALLALALLAGACGGDDDVTVASEAASEPSAETEAEADASAPPFEGTTIVVENWENYMPEDLVERIRQDLGIEVEVALHATNEEAVARMTASGGGGVDVLFVSSPFAEGLNEQGLLAELDPAQLPNLANLYEQAGQLEYDPGNAFSVPYAWGTTGLCYRSDLVTDEPTSWNALLDPPEALAGKVTMLATDRWLLLPALKVLGYSANTVDEAEIAEAQQLLVDAKDTLLAYDDTTFFSRLVSGEAELVESWDGWCNYAIAENTDVRFVVPDEGSDVWVDTMVIPAASENVEAAHAFLNYILQPENGQWVAENILYKVPNQAAMEALDPALLEQYPNMAITPDELLEAEELRALGEGQPLWSRVVSEVTAG